MDSRVAKRGCVDVRPNFEVRPDVVGDFRAMPFEDGAFQLVLFDPPHNVRDDPNNGYIGLKYGALSSETEQDDLRRGFAECWRVLAPGGTLVFKWAGALERVKPHFPDTPIVGTRSPRGGQTRWFIFYKPVAMKLPLWQMFVAPRLRDGFWFECQAPNEAAAWKIGREWHPGAKVDRPLLLDAVCA